MEIIFKKIEKNTQLRNIWRNVDLIDKIHCSGS